MKANELAKKLASDVENVCRHLLPEGKRTGHEWRCGGTDGDRGKSLGVHLSGDKAGVWCDFATGESGDLIGLWMAVRGSDLLTTCTDVMSWLGIKETKVENPKRSWTRPTKEGVSALLPQHAQWLREVRKLSPEAVKAYKLVTGKGALMFPYLRDGELIFAKYRKIPAKDFFIEANAEPCLFGWQAIPKSARQVVITEGELDAMALYDYGIPALSVPMGGGKKGKQDWIENEYDRLAVYDDVILALDADKTGADAVAEIVKRLGRERVRVATLPHKDANECLKQGVPREEIQRCIREAKAQDPENLHSAADYEDAVWSEFVRSGQGETGLMLPWGRGGECVLRPGETSLWAGINGHGKSQVAGQIVVHALNNNRRACVASMEFLPPKLLRRLQIQQIKARNPTEAQSRMCSRSWRESLWVFDATGPHKDATILDAFAYSARRYGVDLFVLDNLAKLGIAEDNYAGQAEFVNRLTEFARTYNVHCILVAHVKKSDKGENAPPDKGDVKGSGGITDLVDTVFTVWRNKPKEALIRACRDRPVDAETLKKPDCIIACHKQRNGDSEPAYLLAFEPATYLYSDNRPNRSLTWSAEA